VTSKVANLLDRSLRYFETGAGRVVLFLHGFPLSAEMWWPQLARAPQGWRFVAPDLRGFRGRGPAFEQPGLAGTTMDDYARDMIALLDHLDVPRAVVCGLSMGGYAAFAMARLAASRLEGLVLSDTRAGADSPDGRAARDAMRGQLAEHGVNAVAASMLPRLLGDTTKRDQPELAEVVRSVITANYPAAVDAAIVAMRDRPDARGDLASITSPTLVMCGEEDALTPMTESEAMASAIPGASLARVPRAGHLSNLEQPAAFNAALTQFLERL